MDTIHETSLNCSLVMTVVRLEVLVAGVAGDSGVEKM